MADTLLAAVRHYVEAYADPAGLAQTPVPGLTTIPFDRARRPGPRDLPAARLPRAAGEQAGGDGISYQSA